VVSLDDLPDPEDGRPLDHFFEYDLHASIPPFGRQLTRP
jgi:hypothetical protein